MPGIPNRSHGIASPLAKVSKASNHTSTQARIMRNTLYMKAFGIAILVLVIVAVAYAVLSMGKTLVHKATQNNQVWEQTN